MNSQNWAETQASVQSPLQKLIFGNSGQILHKSRYQSLLILLLIVCKKESLRMTFPCLFQTSFFVIILTTSKSLAIY